MDYSEVAAKWWVNKLRSIFAGQANYNNGVPGVLGIYVATGQAEEASATTPNPENLDKFEKLLAEEIRNQIPTAFMGELILSVDYNPDGILLELAKKCQISTKGFPYKTTMWIKEKQILLKDGYVGPIRKIFPSGE